MAQNASRKLEHDEGIVVRLGSSYVNCNSNNANFGLRTVNDGCVNNNNNLANSNGNENDNYYGVLPVDSKKLWYS